MDSIEEQYQKIVEHFPEAILIDNMVSHIKIHLENNVSLDIDYKSYPKKPKVKLIKANGEVFGNLDMMVSSLKTWKKKAPVQIVDLINECLLLIQGVQASEVLFKRELMQGILELCKEQHPREILGMLRMEEGIISEFVLPPGSVRSNNAAVFSPSRIPLDPSIAGTVHSHPSGNPTPSDADVNIFKRGHVHFIIGYPYNFYTIRCYDQNGNPLNFRLVD